MAPSDDSATPAPPPTTHTDDRELGFGAVDARPDVDGARDNSGADGIAASGAAPGKLDTGTGGGESAGGAYATGPTPSNRDGDHAGQSHQGYSGSPNPNAASTKQPSQDRAN